jgi:hypothetical protein
MTTLSLAGLLPIVTVWPGAEPVTPATLMLLAPAAGRSGRVVAGCTTKSVHSMSSS